jgi:cell division protein FtsB
MQTRTLWKLAYATAVLAIVSYGVAQYRGFHGVTGLRARQLEIQELTESNARLRAEVGHKQQHIDRLTNNPVEQELEIRKRLRFVKPGEQVYILQDGNAQPKNEPKPAPTPR